MKSINALPNNPLVTLLAALVLLAFAATLATVLFAPIYPDEIAARVWLSRFIFDFPYRINLYPTCSTAFAQLIPFSWLIPGFIEWLLHGNTENLVLLRIEGVAFALLWVGLLTRILSTSISPVRHDQTHAHSLQSRYLYSAGIVVALLAIGVMPVFLVTNRQEQLIITAVILLLYLHFSNKDTKLSNSRVAVMLIAFLALSSIILYAHPKGLFLSPMLIVIGLAILRHLSSTYIKVAVSAIFLTLLLQSYAAWKFSFQCPEAPLLESFLHSFAINPGTLINDPGQFWLQVKGSLTRFTEYPHQLGFRSSTDIHYLPTLPHTIWTSIANLFIWINVIALFIVTTVLVSRDYVRADLANRKLVTINGALAAAVAGLLITSTFNLTKTWYDAAYSYFLLVAIFVFYVANNRVPLFGSRVTRNLLIYLFVVAAFSQALFVVRYLPAYLAGYSGPSISLLRYNAAERRAQLDAAANRCGIDPVHSNKLIVDDYTYSYFRTSKQPMSITYIYYMNTPEHAREFIANSGSDGVIARCDYIPASLSNRIKQVGANVCCITKSDMPSN